MRLFVVGGAGNAGRRTLVRDRAKLETQLEAPAPSRLRIVEGAAVDGLESAMTGHDAVINAAGNINDGASYAPLVRTIITEASRALGEGGRFWLFGGAAALDVPSSGQMTLELPQIPAIFKAHRTNYEVVRETGLDWSMLCPGPMIDAPDGKPTEGLRLAADVWPVARPVPEQFLPPALLALAFARAIPQMTIYYEDAAKVILDHLATDERFSCKRVGVALPLGEERQKG
jgi:uncharacterized protein